MGRSSGQLNPATVSAELQAKIDKWDKRAMKAAGELYLLISDDQKTHLEAITSDPVAIWKKLASIHLQQRPAARFNAYDTFFSIQKAEDESLTALMTRVDQAMLTIQNLRPAKFDIAELDKELTVMTLIRALPSEYSTFASSLQLIENLDKDKVQSAFINEELLRTRTTTSSSSLLGARCIHSSFRHSRRQQQSHLRLLWDVQSLSGFVLPLQGCSGHCHARRH